MVAIYAHGNFVALPAFSHRVRFLPNAGIVLAKLVTLDSGNYSVTISGLSAGMGVTLKRTVILDVQGL